jgi:hypothetical protein
MDDKRGVVYLLTGPSHGARLVVSIWSLRKHYHGPVTLFTTRPESHGIGQLCAADPRLGVNHVTFKEIDSRKNSSFLTKVALPGLTPYAITSFLDADTIVTGDVFPLMEFPAEDEFCTTQFSNWRTDQKVIRRRVEGWRAIRPSQYDDGIFQAMLDEALQPRPAVNSGVFAFHRHARILKPWLDLAVAGRHTFICDEVALQILLPHFPHRVLDCRFNCSPIHGVNKENARIWHFHGDKHLVRAEARALWLPVYCECVRENVADLARWTPGADRTLGTFLERNGETEK